MHERALLRVDRIGSQYLTVAGGTSVRRIAYQRRAARAGLLRPGIVFLGGIKSQMDGIKGSHLDRYAAKTGRAFLRFDYSGHGLSDGVFEAGTIGMWLEESLAAIRTLTTGPQILVGSSMGGWLALLAAKSLHESGETERLKGLILLAPAVDFTEVLLYQKMPASTRAELMQNGIWFRPSAHSPERNPVTRRLIEEGATIFSSAATFTSTLPSISCKACGTKMFPGRMRWPWPRNLPRTR
jgi:pimeloyl-ACP methyl ester carboxylesterase